MAQDLFREPKASYFAFEWDQGLTSSWETTNPLFPKEEHCQICALGKAMAKKSCHRGSQSIQTWEADVSHLPTRYKYNFLRQNVSWKDLPYKFSMNQDLSINYNLLKEKPTALKILAK